MLARIDRPRAQHQRGKIELEFMPIAWRIRTFYLAQTAFVTKVDYPLIFCCGQIADVVALGIYCLEQRWKRWAKVKTQPATVTYIEDSLDFLVELGALPVFRLIGIIRQAVGGPGLDSAAPRYR